MKCCDNKLNLGTKKQTRYDCTVMRCPRQIEDRMTLNVEQTRWRSKKEGTTIN
jgi:hypothetical protein